MLFCREEHAAVRHLRRGLRTNGRKSRSIVDGDLPDAKCIHCSLRFGEPVVAHGPDERLGVIQRAHQFRDADGRSQQCEGFSMMNVPIIEERDDHGSVQDH